MKQRYHSARAYRTKDGSLIREMMHPLQNGNRAQSLAEAVVEPGACTILHRHHKTEELYHITAGAGIMTLGDARFEVRAGDTICIPPGTAHRILNSGSTALRFLCCCSPAYSHDDTELLESAS
jgi:mannose-6-phosphate isomerase-like protein (cupin superfamily)